MDANDDGAGSDAGGGGGVGEASSGGEAEGNDESVSAIFLMGVAGYTAFARSPGLNGKYKPA